MEPFVEKLTFPMMQCQCIVMINNFTMLLRHKVKKTDRQKVRVYFAPRDRLFTSQSDEQLLDLGFDIGHKEYRTLYT